MARENETNRIIKKIVEDGNTSSADKMKIKRELCNLDINYGEDKVVVSNAYLCIAKLYEEEGNILYAIKNTSYSIDVLTGKKNTQYLSNIIIGSGTEYTNSILKKYNLQENDWVGGPYETVVLEEFSKSNNKTLSGRANYRLSLIYSLGLWNSEYDKNTNLSDAFEYQKAAIEALSIQPKKTTNIALVFNEKYASYAATTITSIILNSDLDNKYNIYAIYDSGEDPLTQVTKKKIASLSKFRDFKIEFIEFPENIIESRKKIFEQILDEHKKRFPRLVYFRLFLDELFPHLDQIVALDVDILVLRDLYDLANIDMDEYFIAATTSSRSFTLGRLHRKTECQSLPVVYYSAGVMVSNLKLMRTDATYTKLRDAEYKCNYKYPEQDQFNMEASGRIITLPSKWNIIPSVNDDIDTTYPSPYSPFIIHYMIKPFDNRYTNMLKNNYKLPDHISLYYKYNDFVKEVINDNTSIHQ